MNQIKTIEELTNLLDSETSIKVAYETTVKLTKKNRTTKAKLADEYPHLSSLMKTSIYECGINKTFDELVLENKRDEAKPIVEGLEVKKERKSYYSHINNYLLQNLTKPTMYLYPQILSSTESYQAVLESLEATLDVEKELNNIKANYCPKETDYDAMMEKQWTKKPVEMKQLILDNVLWIEVNGEKYLLDIKHED